MKNEGRQVINQKCRGKRNVVRNEKRLRDMHRELRIIALVSTCPPIHVPRSSSGRLEGQGNQGNRHRAVLTPWRTDPYGSEAE